MILSHSSVFSAFMGDTGITPALLKMTSMRPNFSRANATNAFTSARLTTSRLLYSATPPRSRISAAIFCRRSVRRAPRTTLAPCSASSRAVASPMPLLAPVMRTTRPATEAVEGVMFDMMLLPKI
jgi:hypothetical protein